MNCEFLQCVAQSTQKLLERPQEQDGIAERFIRLVIEYMKSQEADTVSVPIKTAVIDPSVGVIDAPQVSNDSNLKTEQVIHDINHYDLLSVIYRMQVTSRINVKRKDDGEVHYGNKKEEIEAEFLKWLYSIDPKKAHEIELNNFDSFFETLTKRLENQKLVRWKSWGVLSGRTVYFLIITLEGEDRIQQIISKSIQPQSSVAYTDDTDITHVSAASGKRNRQTTPIEIDEAEKYTALQAYRDSIEEATEPMDVNIKKADPIAFAIMEQTRELVKVITNPKEYKIPKETTAEQTRRWLEKSEAGMSAAAIVDDEHIPGKRSSAINKVQKRISRNKQ